MTGVGLPWSPGKGITITPWFEASPAVGVDTVIEPMNLSAQDELAKYCDVATQQCNNLDPNIGADIAKDLVAQSVKLDVSLTAGARGGLDLSAHLNEAVDFNLGASIGTLDRAFKGTRVIWAGAALV